MMNKRVKATLMLMVWIFSIFSTIGLQVSGDEGAGILSIKNNIIELLVSKEDARFAVRTVEGVPERQEDENVPLLFTKDVPETTFTTFRIDGKDYIFGNFYNGIQANGGIVLSPETEGMKSTSTWKVGDITVTQQLELTDNVKSSDVGNVKISYSITNTGTKSREVGTRVLLDMMLGNNDGCKVSLDGKADITNETEVSGADIPVYWRCTDSVDNPKVVSYGFIKGWGNTEPDRMTIAHWNALSTSKWDYLINPQRNIGSSLNDYKSADSAVALYWEPKTLEPAKTIKVETYYGMGNINQSTDGSTFNFNAVAPAKLSIEGDKYKDNPFDIMMELDNSLETSVELAGITAELVLPEGMELAEGQESSRYFYRIPDKFKQTATWKVKASNTQKLRVLQYMIRLTSMGKEIANVKKYIIIPGFSKDDFDIGYTDVAPRNLYYNDEDNAIQLIGYGFNKLIDKSSYEISLVNTSGSNTHYPAAVDITVVNDNQIRIKIPKGLQTGKYRVSINHKNDLFDYTLTQEVTLTSEEKYKSRNYGILLINEQVIGGKKVDSAKLVESEAQISSSDKKSAILIIRGKIKSVSEGRFDVYGDTVAINNDIYYRGYDDKVLSVYQNGDSFIVKGNGELYMETALLGKSMEITLKKGHFLIDSAAAAIKDEEGYISDASVIYIGYFPILVKDIKIQNNGEVKVDGLLELENNYFKFLTGDVFDTDLLKSDMKDIKITNKKIDIDAEFTIPFPRWKLGDFQSKDYATDSTTEVTFFINTIKGAYGFNTKAQNLKLRLRDINSTMAFDKNLYPDYFEFKNDYGDIPEPIGNTGLAFESIGGGIYGLKSLIDSLRYGVLPTGSSIVARADIVDLPTYYARINGKTMIGLLNNEIVLSSGGLDLKGDGYIYFIKAGDFVGHFDLYGGYIKSNIDILDILIMEAYFGINSNEIKGSIKAKVQVPGYVWFIGGKTIGGFSAGLSTSEIDGSIKFMGVGVGINYKWASNKVKFDVESFDLLGSKGIYTVNTKDAQGRDVTVTYGTNIEKLKDIGYSYDVCYSGDLSKTLALGASNYKYDVVIDKAVETAIIEMKYNSSETPVIKVMNSDGIEYALVDEADGAENANYRNQIIPADVSTTGKEEKRLFVTIPSPKLGKWTINSDQEVAMTLYNAKVPASFESLSAKQEADKLKIDWTLNTTDETIVSLYLMREDGASESIELVKDLPGGLAAYECNIPQGATTGKYKAYAEVKRKDAASVNTYGFDNIYSDGFEIIDADAPGLPAGFTVKAAGNGMLEAKWDKNISADEYRIYAVDDKGNLDQTIKTMVSADGDKVGTIFGGTMKDDKGKEYGWLPGREYKFALYAIKKTVAKDSKGEDIELDHISRPAYAEKVYLPVSEPPEFTVSFTAENGNINVEKDQNDDEIRYTNTGNISCNYKSDKVADVTFYVNGEKIDIDENKLTEYNLQLSLKSGSSIIEIEAVNENGDKNIKAYEFYYDNKAPDLMVQSPNNNDIITAGMVLVSGKTTVGSNLYVNGTQMTVSEDGSFNEEYNLSNVQSELITVASVDLAGNKTEYSAEVLNSAVSKIVKVRVIPSVTQMSVGDSLQMRLYGVTEDNKQLLLEAEKAGWQLYDTEGAATMSSYGLLNAEKQGEIIVNGQYIVSNDTTYEDALIIQILPKSAADNDNDSHNDEDEPIAIPNNNIKIVDDGTKADSLVKKAIDFKANDEIEIPGLLKLKFTGNEVLPNGYIEVLEIKDLLKYREQSGNKDFLSNIYDINTPAGYKFNSPVGLTLHFDKNKVKDLKHIAIYVYNEETYVWEIAGGVVDEENGTITVICPHFSKYAVMENSRMTLMTDMERHWARGEVYRLIDRGIVNGIKGTDGKYKFEPERKVTRAEFAKLLSLCEGFKQNGAEASLSSFEDDADIQPWARPYMEHCSKKGWIKGKSVGKAVYIKPNDTITRAEAAAMISRGLDFTAVDKIAKAEFSDKDKIPNWAAGYIDQLLEKKLMMGNPDDTFGPDKMLTRAEAAKIFDTYVFIRDREL